MNLAQRLSLIYIRTKFKILSFFSARHAAETAFQLFCTPPTRDKKRLPELFKRAESLQFRFHQYDVKGYRWNKGGSKRVLILHGFESTAINFAAYVEPLVKKGYEVLAFDAPAHGHSSGKRITALVYRDLVKYINAHYGPVRSYMGHSFGGFALSLALAELPHDDGYRAVFLAPSTETSTAINQFFRYIKLNNRVRSEFDKHVERIGGHPVSWFSMLRTTKEIKAKILWIHDKGDQVTPLGDALKVKEENHSHVEFVITEGLGHSRIYREPEVIRQVVDFL